MYQHWCNISSLQEFFLIIFKQIHYWVGREPVESSISRTLFSRFPYLYLRLLLLSVLHPSTVNKEAYNTPQLFSCPIFGRFSFRFFFVCLSLVPLNHALRQLNQPHFMTYDVTIVKWFPILPEVSLRFLVKWRFFVFQLALKPQKKFNVSQITIQVLVFESIFSNSNILNSSS